MIIGISGKLNSGKDTAADIIMASLPHMNWERKKFAYKLKLISAIILGCDPSEFESHEFKDTNLPDEWQVGGIVENLTPRKFLQLIGTEGGRNIIHPNIWVLSLFTDYREHSSNWIITDVRFPNEADAIKDRGGILIRVNRNVDRIDSHSSEMALDDYLKWDYLINNFGTRDDFQVMVQDVADHIRQYILL